MSPSKPDTKGLAKVDQNMLHGRFQRFVGGVGRRLQPLILDLAAPADRPQGLNLVQMRTVSRQKEHVQALALPLGYASGECFGAAPADRVNRGVVQHQNGGLDQTPGPLVNTINDKLTVNTLLGGETDQVSSLIEPGQHVEPGTIPTRTLRHQASHLPTVGHYRQETKARLITVKQIDMALHGQRLQVCQAAKLVGIVSRSKQL